jgi:uncharacterized membrane protein
MGTIYDFVSSNLIRNLAFTYITNKLAFWTSRNLEVVHCMVFRLTFLTDKILNISLHTQPNLIK